MIHVTEFADWNPWVATVEQGGLNGRSGPDAAIDGIVGSLELREVPW